jgi:NAD(P)-dependent dehydrogenase (short-subunit alcohol dehydrogenase family)
MAAAAVIRGWALAALACFAPACAYAQAPAAQGTVLVTGANRGLGLEFVRQYAASGWTVIAAARNPQDAAELRELAQLNSKIAIETLDVRDEAKVEALAAKYRGTPIDVLINNAGVLGDLDAQALDSLDYAEFEEVMAVNVFAALAVSSAFREHVASSAGKKIVAITSRSGIISLPGWRGPYFYRASKIALNMVMRMLADEVRDSGIVVAVVAPMPTDTDMLRELIGPEGAARQAKPADSVAGLIELISRVDAAQSGQPLLVDGSALPW